MARVAWTPQALDDLEAICRYIERDSPQMAKLLVQRAFALVERLEGFPRMGRMVPEVERDELRELILFGYRIIYRLLAQVPQ